MHCIQTHLSSVNSNRYGTAAPRRQHLRYRSAVPGTNSSAKQHTSRRIFAMSWLWTFGSVPESSPERVQEMAKSVLALTPEERAGPSTLKIIDVRTASEYMAGRIEGSHANASFLPPWSFASRIEPILANLEKDTPILLVCLSAHRSIGALKWMREKGYTNVQQLAGGMKAWRAAGLPEVGEGNPVEEGPGAENVPPPQPAPTVAGKVAEAEQQEGSPAGNTTTTN